MSHSLEIKDIAIKLRHKGFSLNEISSKLNISKSTSSLWLKTIVLNNQAQLRLKKKQILGQYKSMQIAKEKRTKRRNLIDLATKVTVSKIPKSKEIFKLITSILFWTEGGKSTDSYVYFMNSDSKMIKLFVYLLRNSFELEESKFRVMMHIHEYHNENKQVKYWSKLTGIPASQFSKSYLKPHTGKRIRANYQGCTRIRYYDTKIALELRSLYNTYADSLISE
jgi:predicted transcriptional regulator